MYLPNSRSMNCRALLSRVASAAFVVGAPLLARADDAAASAPASTITPGDTAWMLTATALVLMMTVPGLALFYGGLVRAKNVLSTIMHSFFCAGLVSIVWVLIGYSFAFGPDHGGWIGGLEYYALHGTLDGSSAAAPKIPHLLFVMYQATFAIITPALISGAFAERMRFSAFALFTLLWSVLIYSPLAHWVWGGGWIMTRVGALDFAGGTVVHISSGVAAFVTALFIGRRAGYGHDPMPPHNLPFTVLGGSLLWVGWFGFNAGSALESSGLAALAFLNTNTAAASAALGWIMMEGMRTGKPTILGIVSGAVAGLVVITPAAGFVTPPSAILMGLAGGIICYFAVSLKPRFGYDDALDVVGIHLVGGTLGALLTGVFATVAANPAIESLSLGLRGGVVEGGYQLLWQQFIAVIATYAFAGVGTLILLLFTNMIFRIRAVGEEEVVGLDLSQHSERAYALGGGETTPAHVAQPKAAAAPPASGARFSVLLEGLTPAQVTEAWRELCRAPAASEEFKEVYRQLTTIRANRLRFRGGDRERLRKAVETVFRGAKAGGGVSARVEA